MAGRKNLNDTIHGDRASIRGYEVKGPMEEGFTDNLFPSDRKTKIIGSDRPDRLGDTDWKDRFYNGGVVSKYEPRAAGTFSCGKTHPPLKLPGTDFVIEGGSCISPNVTDADVYIGFDGGMRFGQRHWPWKKGTEILFKIQDMGTPSDPAEFHKLIKWTREALEKGSKIHCGCIGGHGRTGTFLSALVSTYGEKDAVKYVRDNYCRKAVESNEQTKFLCEEFGTAKAIGSKSAGGEFDRAKSYKAPSSSSGTKSTGKGGLKVVKKGNASTEVYNPLPGNGNIFVAAK